jgi:hypothetical protein
VQEESAAKRSIAMRFNAWKYLEAIGLPFTTGNRQNLERIARWR